MPVARIEDEVELDKEKSFKFKKTDVISVAKNYLEKADFPSNTREGVISEGMLLEKDVWIVTFSDPDPNARAGAWILYFDPLVPLEQNPVKAVLQR